MDLLRQSLRSCRLGGRNDGGLRCTAEGQTQPLDRLATSVLMGTNSEIAGLRVGDPSRVKRTALTARPLHTSTNRSAPFGTGCGYLGERWIRAFPISKGFSA